MMSSTSATTDTAVNVAAESQIISGPLPSSKSSFFKEKWREAAFLISVTSVSIFVGFSRAISNAKQKESNAFDKIPNQTAVKIQHEATNLAFRALKWGTFYAVCGTGVLTFTIWKLFGVSNLQEFRNKAGNMLPRLSKDKQEGRTEFENLSDLFQYLIDEDEKAKQQRTHKTLTSQDTSHVNNVK